MGLRTGTTSLRRFFITSRTPASSHPSWLEGLHKGSFVDRKLDPGEDNIGWAVCDDELSTDFNLENTTFGKFLCFSLRKDVLRIPAALIRMHLKRRIHERAQSLKTESQGVGREQQKELKAEVIQELSQKIIPSTQLIQLMVDPVHREILVTATSDAQAYRCIEFFTQCFSLKAVQADPMATAQRLLQKEAFEEILDRPDGAPLDQVGEKYPDFEDGPASRLGAGFMTWMHFHLFQRKDGWRALDERGPLMVTDELMVLEGEVEGSRQTAIKRGDAYRCPETLRALQAGKLVSRMKFWWVEGEEDQQDHAYQITLDRHSFDLLGMKLPKATESDLHNRLLERFQFLSQGFRNLDEIFELYLELRLSSKWKSVKKNMRHWIIEQS